MSLLRGILVLVLALAACEAAAKEPIDIAAGCKANPGLASSCFVLRGRLSAYNGSPTFRIWPIGTSRLLGVVPSEDARSLSPELRGVAGFEQDVFGTFTVCPFTAHRSGVMQFVCVEAVREVHFQGRARRESGQRHGRRPR